ncbi:hypothetical protein TELCIR_18671 [Teladorsagia circumcincta]|uniref:RRP12 HEAT domain-containing protein n=1 Tax=Teladorsagia circumcincta TaxID=45464 RepID=A0A2G9TPD7_TELCI|nr:hypothetical protein TELCIR_18671 [Teladorsagia circumcincta]
MLENSESHEGSALKYLLSVLGVVLRAQPAGVWNVANTKNMVVSVAALSAHEKPWVRTMARRVVRAVLTDPITAMENGLHAASSSVGLFIQQQLQSALASKNGEMTAMRYLCLLEGVMHKMPSSLFKQLAENILSSFAIADPMVLGAAMNERSDLRLQILSALRRVLRFALLPDAPPERVEVVSRYAKNFMPLLFNLYTANADDQDDKGVRMSVLETIRTYAEVTPKELVANFVDAAITKANGAFEDPPKQSAKHSTVSGASTWRPGGQGIHRDTSVKGVKKRPAKSSGDKKNQKLQPYAYVPLRQKGVKQDLVKVLKSQRKAGVSKKNKKH